MKHIGIFPAVGSGLRSMAATGQLERLYVHLGAYTDQCAVTYHTYLDYAGEVELWRRFTLQTGANLVGAPGATVREGFLWPLRDARRFKSLNLCRVMSLRGAPPALMAHWLWRIPFVVSIGNDYEGIARLHGRSGWKIRWFQRLVARWASALFVNNKARATRMRQTNRRVHYIPSWVDLERFSPTARRTLARRRSGRRLLYVGRLVVEKNLVPVARSARRLGVEFVCVGVGPEEVALRAAGATCVGVVSWEELPGWYRGADAFILPSLLEGHPKALLEALACGRLCFVSATLDGCRDLPIIRFDPRSVAAIDAVVDYQGLLPVPSEPFMARYAKEQVLPHEVQTVLAAC